MRNRELPLKYGVLPTTPMWGASNTPGRLLGRPSGKTRKEGQPLRLPFLLFPD